MCWCLAGDALEDEFELSGGSGSEEEDDEDDEGGAGGRLPSGLEARRAERAAGDHPLQRSFREASAVLLAKYGVSGALVLPAGA